MITAEQVREAIEENSWKEAFMLREFNESSWQAIADELNAAMGVGTCKNLANHQGCTEFVCSECGAHYLGFRFKYCPGCGAKVVEG